MTLLLHITKSVVELVMNVLWYMYIYGCQLALRYFKRSSEKGHMIRAHI